MVELSPAKQPRARRSALALREAARQVIARDGYAGARIADIAQEARRGIGTFYSHFRGKEALLEALAEDFRIDLTARIQPPGPEDADPIAHLRGTVRAFWETYTAHRPIALALFQAALTDAHFAAIWRSIRADGVRVSGARIRAAQALGYCPGLDPERAATALCAMVEFACFEWCGGLGDAPAQDDEAVVKTLTDLMTHAIGWRATD